MVWVVKHAPKLGSRSQQEALDGVARAYHPALPGACPDIGPVLTREAVVARHPRVGSSYGQECLLLAMIGQAPAGASFG